MSEKKKRVKITSPIGKLQWFKFIVPDKKYNKYTADLIVEDSPEIHALMEKIENMITEGIAEEKAKAKEAGNGKLLVKIKDSGNRPIEPEVDSQGEETGRFVMKFRMAASGKKKDGTVYELQKPALFNAQARPYTEAEKKSLMVFNGSEGRISFELSTYFVAAQGVGVKMSPKGAQIIKIVSQSEQADDYGFDSFGEDDIEDSDSPEFDAEVSEGSDDEDF